MSRVQHRTVEASDAEQRLDRWFFKYFPKLPRGRLQKLLRTGQVRVDGKRAKAGLRLNIGQKIRIPPISDVPVPPQECRRSITESEVVFVQSLILHMDQEIIVINKPAGLAVQGGSAVRHHLDGMLDALRFDVDERPRLIHRLDKDTSGVMVIAKNNFIHLKLAEQFKVHSITRKYQSIVWGIPNNQSVEGFIERHKINRKKMILNKKSNGKFSKTEIKLIQSYQNASLVECTLHTGRTHQIRLHLTSINSPIVGDQIYGKNQISKYGLDKKTFNKFLILKHFSRQALHATHLGFIHPRLKKNVEFNSKLPSDMQNLIDLLLKY